MRAYSDLARLGGVTPARMTHIMGMLNLAPDIQEALLFLPLIEKGATRLTLPNPMLYHFFSTVNPPEADKPVFGIRGERRESPRFWAAPSLLISGFPNERVRLGRPPAFPSVERDRERPIRGPRTLNWTRAVSGRGENGAGRDAEVNRTLSLALPPPRFVPPSRGRESGSFARGLAEAGGGQKKEGGQKRIEGSARFDSRSYLAETGRPKPATSVAPARRLSQEADVAGTL